MTQKTKKSLSGIYIHIPFCRQKCIYCNFYSIRSDEETIAQYVDCLLKEIHIRKDYLSDKKIDTIYFGGGTPSLLNISQINRITDKLSKYFDLSSVREVTFEANPENISENYLKELSKETIINRLSIGIQSFFDEDLKFLNRKHSSEQSIYSIKKAQEVGFDNISIDFIYGIPSLTNEKWIQNLRKGFELNISHISAYALTVEPDTILDIQIRKGKTPEPSESSAIEHFKILTQLMQEHGYEHYEISNFAKPEFYSKHNSSYWNGTHYLGLGASAHSFDGNSRQWNYADIRSYTSTIHENKIFFEKEILTENDRFNEYVMTSLRTSKGINKEYLSTHFEDRLNKILEKNIRKYIEENLIEETNSAYILTFNGKLFADRIAGNLFV